MSRHGCGFALHRMANWCESGKPNVWIACICIRCSQKAINGIVVLSRFSFCRSLSLPLFLSRLSPFHNFDVFELCRDNMKFSVSVENGDFDRKPNPFVVTGIWNGGTALMHQTANWGFEWCQIEFQSACNPTGRSQQSFQKFLRCSKIMQNQQWLSRERILGDISLFKTQKERLNVKISRPTQYTLWLAISNCYCSWQPKTKRSKTIWIGRDGIKWTRWTFY